MEVISIVNRKGGTAKTVTAVNISAALKLNNKRVLLIDLDPQKSATDYVLDYEPDLTIYDLVSNSKVTKKEVTEAIIKLDYFDFIPASESLVDFEFMQGEKNLKKVKKIIELIQSSYDFIIIDGSPALNFLMLCAIAASTSYIIPINPSFFSFTGIKKVKETVDIVNKNIKFLGVLFCKFTGRTLIEKDILENTPKAIKTFKTVIRTSVEVEYSIEAKTPLVLYNPKNNVAIDYLNLTKEIETNG